MAVKVGEISTIVDEGAASPASPARESGDRDADPGLVQVDPTHYEFEGVHARGGVGFILKAHDRRLRRRVALKQILRPDGAMRARFEREAWLTARLQHPGIVPIYEAGRWPNGESFYAMRLVAGRPLSDVIDDAKTLDQRLALLPKVVAVSDAVAYAHTQGVLHRDLKPHNVMIGAFGDVVVIDWGMAKDLARPDLAESDGLAAAYLAGQTMAGSVVGTPAYMPPEQARGEPVDERSDVYAIGAVLYHLLTGSAPFSGSNSTEVLEQVRGGAPRPVELRQPGVPRDLAAVVRKAMERDPTARYATASELSQELERFVTGQLVRAHQYPRAVLVRRAIRRHPLIGAVGVFAILLAVLGAVAVRRIVVARADAESRGRQLLLGQARALLHTDPTAAVALLKRYPDGGGQVDAARDIALDAESRGVARHVLASHGGDVRDVAFSPDGAQLASAGADGALYLWDAASGAGQRIHSSNSPITNVAFDPAGRFLAASLGALPGMWLHDRKLGTSRTLALEDDVYTIAFSPDGELLAGGAIGGAVYLWNTADGKPRALSGHGDWIAQVEFSPDGRTLLSVSQDKTARLWSIPSGASRVVALDAQGYSGGFSRDGRWVAVGCEDGSVWLHSVDGAAPDRTLRADRAAVDYVAFSPDGERIAWAGFGREVHVAPLGSGEIRSLHGHEDDVTALGFFPDGTLWSGSADATIRLWDLSSGLGAVLRGHRDHIRAVAVGPGGRQIASASADRTVRVWKLASASKTYAIHGMKDGEFRSPSGHDVIYYQPDGGGLGVLDLRTGLVRPVTTRRPYARFAGDPAGARMAYRDLLRKVTIIELDSSAERDLAPQLELFGAAIDFSPDGATLAFPGERGMYLIDVASSAVRELPYPSGPVSQREEKVNRLQFSRDGRRLLTVHGRTVIAEIAIWDLATGRPTVVPTPGRRTPGTLFASRDLTALAAGAIGGLWLFDPGRNLWRSLMTVDRDVYPLAFSDDGRWLASADDRGQVRIWNASDGTLVHDLVGHQGPIRRMEFDSDGARLASAGVDGAMRLWDVVTGHELRVIRAHAGREVEWVGFRGSDLVTAGRDGTVRVWPAAIHPPGPLARLLHELTSFQGDR